MKHRIIAFLVTLFCCAAGFAGNIQADDVSLKPGETKALTLSLTSAVNNMVGIQFDVTLPNGFHLETKDRMAYQLSQNQTSEMTCNVNDLGNGSYRFMLYSNSLQKLRAGELMSLNLRAGSNVAIGNYMVSLHDVVFSDADGQLTNESETTATITLTNFFPAATNIEMTDTKIISGETALLTLKLLESIRGCVGIQFDFSLPEGFLLEKDDLGKEYAIATNQASDVTCNLTAVSNGVYRFMIYSKSLKEFVPGELMNINLKVSKEKPLETFSVSIHDVQLSDISGNVHNDNGANANVQVTNYFTLAYFVDGTKYKTASIEYGSSIMAETEPTKEGYTFSGWSEIPKTMPAHDVTVTGTFTVNSYTLTYVVDGVEYQTIEVEFGTALTPIDEPTKTGYTFTGWVGLPELMPANNVTVVGSFSINSYILTYVVDGVVYKSEEVEYGSQISAPIAPEKEGYTFVWTDLPATMPAHDVTVNGIFTINTYKIIYMVDGKEYKSLEMEYGLVISPEPAPTKEGYTFSGWSEIPNTVPSHDITITGSFTINKYNLTYVVDGVEYKTIEVEYGTTLTPIDEPTKTGYTFTGWVGLPETMPSNDVTVVGSFSINSYTLTYIVDGVEYKTAIVEYGATITPESNPTKEGYTFSGWSEIPETMPAHDVTITGSFTKGAYILTYIVDGVVYKTVSYDFDDTITPESAPTKEGYTFSGWSEIPETMPANNVTVTGTFSVNSYKVTFVYGDSVLTTIEVKYGEAIELPTSLNSERYTLVEWKDVPDTMPAHDITIYADYVDGINTITADSKDEQYIRLNGMYAPDLNPGLNIIRMKDGTTKKIWVK